jgi:hypothetical protein
MRFSQKAYIDPALTEKVIRSNFLPRTPSSFHPPTRSAFTPTNAGLDRSPFIRCHRWAACSVIGWQA